MELNVAKVKKEKNRYFYWLWLISNPIDFAQILAEVGLSCLGAPVGKLLQLLELLKFRLQLGNC